MNIDAQIMGISYVSFLSSKLKQYEYTDFDKALNVESAFILNLPDDNSLAISRWVSPKRTRSYPYARVYNTLNFQGKKVTIIPFYKDEGMNGDKDFIQWDTVSLMSLLNVYVIIGNYNKAQRNIKYQNKITKQEYDYDYLRFKISELLKFGSDALHWNLEQMNNINEIGLKALEDYGKIQRDLNVRLHDDRRTYERIKNISKDVEEFKQISRNLAKSAQNREMNTIQPKEKIEYEKASITIKNFIGGYYYFTADEVIIEGKKIFLIECKHTDSALLPSIDDIKDGLLKMILFCNLEKVIIDNEEYQHQAALNLSSNQDFNINLLHPYKKELFQLLIKESKENNFKIMINNKFIN